MPSSGAAGDSLPEYSSPTWVRWRLVGLLMAISFLNHFNRISISVAGKELIRLDVLSEKQMGLVYSALLYAYTIFMTPGGWFSDKAGGRAALSVVGFGAGTCALLTGVCLGNWQTATGLLISLLIVRGVMGACISAIYPGSGSVVSRWLPFSQRASAMALITGAAPLGIASTFVLFPTMIEQLGLPIAFYSLGSLTIALAVIWIWYARNTPREHSGTNAAEQSLVGSINTAKSGASKSNSRSAESQIDSTASGNATGSNDWSRLLKNRSLWLITLSYGALGYMEYLQFYWSDYFFSDVLKFQGNKALMASVAPPLLMCLMMPLGGWLSDRLFPVVGYRRSRALVAGLGMVGSAAALAIATCLTNPAAIVAGFAVSLGLIGLSEGPCWATAIDLGGKHGGTSAGIFNTGGNGFGALAPIITPAFKALLVQSSAMGAVAAWGWSIRLGCLICFAGAILWIWIDPADDGAAG